MIIRPPSTWKVYLIAGEESGDGLGGRLMHSLKQITGGNISFFGVGGEKMIHQGLESLFPMSELAVMGVTEVIARLPLITRRLYQVDAHIRALNPDVLVTIDAPDFCLRVAQRVADLRTPKVHYVAPTVWAWRPRRAKKIAQFLDHLITILPFEPPYFEKYGLDCTYVGHPLLKWNEKVTVNNNFREHMGIGPDSTLIAVLPGSRKSEVLRHIPIFSETIARVKTVLPNLEIVIPTLTETHQIIEKKTKFWKVPVHLTENEIDKYSSFSAADIALAVSGTVALELALTGTPAIIAYKMAPITKLIAKYLVKTRFVNLVNLILNQEAVPEYLLEKCRADLLSNAVLQLINEEHLRNTQKDCYKKAIRLLGEEHLDPSQSAAETILRILNKQ